MTANRRTRLEGALGSLRTAEGVPLLVTMVIPADGPPELIVASASEVDRNKKLRFVKAFQLAFEQAAAEVFGKEIGEETTAYLGFESIQRLAAFVGDQPVRGVISVAVDKDGMISSAVGGPLGADEVARAAAGLHHVTQANLATLPLGRPMQKGN